MKNSSTEMNYDTVLPERIRTSLKHKVSQKSPKFLYQIALALLLLAGLRHLNTVPHREWNQSSNYIAWTETTPGHYGKFHSEQVPHYMTVGHTTTYTTKMTYNPDEWVPEEKVFHEAGTNTTLLYTAEGLFGSSYRVNKNGIDQKVDYKNFRVAFLKTFGTGKDQIRILHEIDR